MIVYSILQRFIALPDFVGKAEELSEVAEQAKVLQNKFRYSVTT